MELGNTAGGICAFANDIRRAPHLQQLAIQMSPQWAATIAQAWKAPQPGVIGNYLATLREQTDMAELCLSTLSSEAPADLRTLAVIDGGNMHTVVPSFSALNHLSLDLCMPPISLAWVRELPQLQTLRLNVLVGHPWQLDLQPMADLAYVFIVGHLPDQLRLPELCQLHVGNTDNAGLFRVVEPQIKPWLTRMDITREQADPGKLALSELLGLDLHLDELMLRFDEIGSDAKPLAISASSWALLRQAKHVTLYARNINIFIASEANLAWLRVRLLARNRLMLSCEKPTEFLSGRTAIMFHYMQSNIGTANIFNVEWQPLAKLLGLTINKSETRSEGKTFHRLWLTTNTAEDQLYLQTPCMCRTCMRCIEHYDLLKV